MLNPKANYFLLFIIVMSCISFVIAEWDGAFNNCEYQLVIVNSENTKQSNIRMDVYNTSAILAYKYPVTDYTNHNSFITDSSGLITFHHRTTGLEFGGAGFPNEREIPKFNLVFKRDTSIVGILNYNKLDLKSHKIKKEYIERIWINKKGKEELIDFQIVKDTLVINN